MKKSLIVLAVLVVLIGGGVGYMFLGQQGGGETPTTREVTLKLYFGNEDASGVAPETRIITKRPGTMEQLIVEELIKGSQTGLSKSIPDGSKLLSVKVIDGVAYVDFSKELQVHHWGGSAGETITLFSVVNSLTELEHIKAVQFLVDGQAIDSLSGHWYTGEPIPRDESQIRSQ